jgi:hypothetical protein
MGRKRVIDDPNLFIKKKISGVRNYNVLEDTSDVNLFVRMNKFFVKNWLKISCHTIRVKK